MLDQHIDLTKFGCPPGEPPPMVCISIKHSCNGPVEFRQVLSSGDSAKSTPLTRKQLRKLHALLLFCAGLFVFGVAATSALHPSGGLFMAGAGIGSTVAPVGANSR